MSVVVSRFASSRVGARLLLVGLLLSHVRCSGGDACEVERAPAELDRASRELAVCADVGWSAMGVRYVPPVACENGYAGPCVELGGEQALGFYDRRCGAAILPAGVELSSARWRVVFLHEWLHHAGLDDEHCDPRWVECSPTFDE